MNKKIQSALISVSNKEGLDLIARTVSDLGITIYSTGGTQQFIRDSGIPVVPVEKITSYPSILGGRVKTLHPSVFGGILGRSDEAKDVDEMKQHNIPPIDLVIVDLYPFEDTVASTNDEKAIIEKIDIGGPSMIRAAAKNFRDVLVVAKRTDYGELSRLLKEQHGETSIEQRKKFAARAFELVAHYDVAIAKYFNARDPLYFQQSVPGRTIMRYGENPHQPGVFFGSLTEIFSQLHGKEISYNNLVDIDAAIQLLSEFHDKDEKIFAIIKHTNICGIASTGNVTESWEAALAGDPESAFGGVLVCNSAIDKKTAEAISEIFFEVLVAPAFAQDALVILKAKKNRILLELRKKHTPEISYRSVLNGVLSQATDTGNYAEWKEVGGRESTAGEKKDLVFANLICKHLKSNAIALVKNGCLIGKGCGQTSRIDALRQAIAKAKQFNLDIKGAVLASDAFFPFDDCVKIGHAAGIEAFIQPGGSIRDKDSIDYCVNNKLVLVMTGMRHFKH